VTIRANDDGSSATGRQCDHRPTPRRWLLVNIDAGRSSKSAFDAWRRLRALGAHYLQPAVCLLPDNPETAAGVDRVVARIDRAGGRARMFPIELPDGAGERNLIAAFSAERSDEYDQVVARIEQFLGEISTDRERRAASYTEVEESRVDLRRFQRRLASIRKRDYFDAPGYARASAAVDACESALAAFEAEAFEAEVHPTEEDLARVPWRLRLQDLPVPGR
jgi:hypothetical protein